MLLKGDVKYIYKLACQSSLIDFLQPGGVSKEGQYNTLNVWWSGLFTITMTMPIYAYIINPKPELVATISPKRLPPATVAYEHVMS